MPRKPQWPPPIHAHKSGQDRVRIKGEDYYLGPTGSEESRRNYAALLAKHARGELEPKAKAEEPPAPKSSAAPAVTVGRVIADWMTREAPRYSERGREVRSFAVVFRVLLAKFRPLPAADFDDLKLEEVRLSMLTGDWMSAEEKAKRVKRKQQLGWSERVVNRRVTRVRTVWRWAERQGLVPKGSWASLKSLPALHPADARVRRIKRRKAVSWEAVKACVARLGGRTTARAVRAMLLLQWWSGCRSQDLRYMRPCDIDRSGPVWGYRPHIHKNDWRGHERVVFLGPKCQSILRPLLSKPGAADRWLFPGRKPGKPIGEGSYPNCVRRACLRAGIEPFQPYQCRHAAKKRIARVAGLEAARCVLGQKCLEATAEYDSEVDQGLAADIAGRMG